MLVSTEERQTAPTRRQRRPRADGQRTRETILRAAVDLASLEGLEPLSIASLADAVGMSKSGLFAHFGSKEELQLATVRAATRILAHDVIDPAVAQPDGLSRAWALCREYIGHVRRGVFAGGCFFTSAQGDFDGRGGPVHDLLVRNFDDWLDLIRSFLQQARDAGHLLDDVDPDDLAFEIEALRTLAIRSFMLVGDTAYLDRGERLVHRRLTEASSPDAPALEPPRG